MNSLQIKSNEEKLRDIFMDVMKPAFPDIKPKNIKVEEQHLNQSDAELADRITKKQDIADTCNKDISLDTITSVKFEGIEVDFEVIKRLKETIDKTTGTWTAYNRNRLQFHDDSNTFLQHIQPEELKLAVQNSSEPQ